MAVLGKKLTKLLCHKICHYFVSSFEVGAVAVSTHCIHPQKNSQLALAWIDGTDHICIPRMVIIGADCSRGVASNSIQKWEHKKCSGIKCNMYKVMKSFICRGCLIPVISTGHTSVDIGASANPELVDTFCYLGDMLSVDGDADAAVEARIRTGWNKFRQLVPLLTNRDISLIRTGRLFSSCVRSRMLHGSETWPVRKENEVALQSAEMRMIKWMCDVKVKDKIPRRMAPDQEVDQRGLGERLCKKIVKHVN